MNREKNRDRLRAVLETTCGDLSGARSRIPKYQMGVVAAAPGFGITGKGLGPGLDFLASMGRSRPAMLGLLRENEAGALLKHVNLLSQKELPWLFQKLTQHWDSPAIRKICLEILRRINMPTNELVGFLSTRKSLKGVPLRWKQSVWVYHSDCFYRHFKPLIQKYVACISQVNMHDLNAARKNLTPTGLLPHMQRAKNKYLQEIFYMRLE